MIIFFYPSVLIFVLGAQKNCLIEMVLLSTHNKSFGYTLLPRVLNYFAVLRLTLTVCLCFIVEYQGRIQDFWKGSSYV